MSVYAPKYFEVEEYEFALQCKLMVLTEQKITEKYFIANAN